MANKEAFYRLVQYVQNLGLYKKDVRRDLEIQWEHTFERDDAPTSFGFGLSTARLDLFEQGSLGHIQIIHSYSQPSNWPSIDYATYLAKGEESFTPIDFRDLYLWLCETLDPESYFRTANEAQKVWDSMRYAGEVPPHNWPESPRLHAESCWKRYVSSLEHRDLSAFLREQRERGKYLRLD